MELSASLKYRGVIIQYSVDGSMLVLKKLGVRNGLYPLTDKDFGTYMKSIFAGK